MCNSSNHAGPGPADGSFVEFKLACRQRDLERIVITFEQLAVLRHDGLAGAALPPHFGMAVSTKPPQTAPFERNFRDEIFVAP